MNEKIKQWLETPASLHPKRTRVSRSKRAIRKADRAVVRSTSVQLQRGEEASQLYLILKESPEFSEVMNKVPFSLFREHYVNKKFRRSLTKLFKELLDLT